MSAEILRKAASLMRERAKGATWVDFHGNADWAGDVAALGLDADDDAHVASWSPAVALAVADLLDLLAKRSISNDLEHAERLAALAVASAYLGEAS